MDKLNELLNKCICKYLQLHTGAFCKNNIKYGYKYGYIFGLVVEYLLCLSGKAARTASITNDGN